MSFNSRGANGEGWTVGEIIQMTTREFPLEDPPRNWPGRPFAQRDTEPNNSTPQYYRITDVKCDKGELAIYDRSYFCKKSYIPKDHVTETIKVEPMVNIADVPLLSMEKYTGVHWHINVTHMSINQDRDGMPLRTIDRLIIAELPPNYVPLLSYTSDWAIDDSTDHSKFSKHHSMSDAPIDHDTRVFNSPIDRSKFSQHYSMTFGHVL